MVESMMALVLVDALIQQHAQCELFPRHTEGGGGEEGADVFINPLGKALNTANK